MQALIMAAGRSTRAYPLTITKPKPLLKAANKTILEHNLDALDGIADEAVLVVGYKKSMIKKHIGNKYNKIKIKYAEQKTQLGTGHAALSAMRLLKGRFIVMAGDDIYSRQDIKSCTRHRYSMLTSRVSNPQNFGVVVEKGGILQRIIEKPKKFISNKVGTSFYALDTEIFSCLEKVKKSGRGEIELPDAVMALAKEHEVRCVPSRRWIPIAYPWDLLRADAMMRNSKTLIGKGSKCTGKITNSCIGSNCTIEGTVKNSIVMDGSTVGKGSVVEDSVIGKNSYFSGKAISSPNAFSAVKGKRINAGRLGAVVSDNARLKNVTIMPGCKVWPFRQISDKTIAEDVL